jgi:ribonuclease D
MFAESISNEDIVNLPRLVFDGDIAIANTEEDVEKYLPRIMCHSVAGFDTETKPSFRKGVVHGLALLQLAVPNFALLVRVNSCGLTPSLISYFENENFTKVGAAIRDDLKALKRIETFEPKGFVELQVIAPQHGIECLSVRKLAAIVLNVRVSKSQQLSNWESTVLTPPQQEYAAIDAWACREIYLKLLQDSK